MQSKESDSRTFNGRLLFLCMAVLSAGGVRLAVGGVSVSFKDDMYVNRGFLTGPWLPIYGIGGVMLEVLFHRWRDRPVLTFVSSMAVCTMLEYAAGWYLELTWGVKWWDYSAVPWNLHGRVCLYGSIFFGLGGLLLVWLVSPLFYSLYCRIPWRIQAGAGILLLLLFTADASYSAMRPHVGLGVTYR